MSLIYETETTSTINLISLDIFYLILPLFLILILFAIESIRKVLLQHLPQIGFFISSYLFFLINQKKDNGTIVLFYDWKTLNPYLIFIAVIVGLISIVYSSKEKNDLQKGNKELMKRDFFKFCSDFLKISFKNFFQNSHGNGRVSMYLHKNNEFVLIGRYSNNPMFNVKSRSTYPDNEGLIARGWKEDICILHGIPEYRGKGQQYFSKVNSSHPISYETVKKLKMKSRSFYIKRINNEDSRLPHGIIVVEQMDSREINSELMDEIFENEETKFVLFFKGLKSFK